LKIRIKVKELKGLFQYTGEYPRKRRISYFYHSYSIKFFSKKNKEDEASIQGLLFPKIFSFLVLPMNRKPFLIKL